MGSNRVLSLSVQGLLSISFLCKRMISFRWNLCRFVGVGLVFYRIISWHDIIVGTFAQSLLRLSVLFVDGRSSVLLRGSCRRLHDQGILSDSRSVLHPLLVCYLTTRLIYVKVEHLWYWLNNYKFIVTLAATPPMIFSLTWLSSCVWGRLSATTALLTTCLWWSFHCEFFSIVIS